MGETRYERMPVDEAAEHLRRALGLAGADHAVAMPGRLAPASVAESVRMPDWVRSLAVLVDELDTHWLVVTRRGGGMPNEEATAPGPRPSNAGGQFVLPLGAGRYLIETLDGDTGEWIGRESAAGGPVVAGLFCPGGAAVVRIVGLEDSQRPRGVLASKPHGPE